MRERTLARLFCRNFAAAIFCIVATGALKAEPSSWFVGVGGGYGATRIETKYPDSTRNQLGMPIGGGQYTWKSYDPGIDSTAQSWGVAYEILVGYKHFLNDFIGFRYYANVGAQHYKDAVFSGGKDRIGVIDYTANADLLLNFYNSPAFSVGIFGGFGVGGASFDSPVLDNYKKDWGGAKDSTQFREPIYDGMGAIYKHNFSASLSVGARINFYQQLRNAGQLVCRAGSDGRRSCSKPVSTLEHSIEANAKFSLLTYFVTDAGDAVSYYITYPAQGGNVPGGTYLTGVANRPGYGVKTPYRFTLRYIIAF